MRSTSSGWIRSSEWRPGRLTGSVPVTTWRMAEPLGPHVGVDQRGEHGQRTVEGAGAGQRRRAARCGERRPERRLIRDHYRWAIASAEGRSCSLPWGRPRCHPGNTTCSDRAGRWATRTVPGRGRSSCRPTTRLSSTSSVPTRASSVGRTRAHRSSCSPPSVDGVGCGRRLSSIRRPTTTAWSSWPPTAGPTDPLWYLRNLQANPHATVEAGRGCFTVRATFVDGEDHRGSSTTTPS